MKIVDRGERELLEQLDRRLVQRRALGNALAPGRATVREVVGNHLELWQAPALERLIAAVRAILDGVTGPR